MVFFTFLLLAPASYLFRASAKHHISKEKQSVKDFRGTVGRIQRE